MTTQSEREREQADRVETRLVSIDDTMRGQGERLARVETRQEYQATKEDVARVDTRISEMKEDTVKADARVSEMKEEMATKEDVARVETRIIKWLVVTIIALGMFSAAVAGALFAAIKLT